MDPVTYDTPNGLDLELRIPSGSISVATSDAAQTTLHVTGEQDDDVVVRFDSTGEGRHRLVVEQRRRKRGWAWRQDGVQVEVSAPADTRLRVETGSTDLHVTGPLASASFHSGSGDASLDQVRGDVDVKVASGDLRVSHVGGRLGFHSASGDLQVDGVDGAVVARTASGDVTIGAAGGDVRITTVSGDVDVADVAAGSTVVQAVSGDVSVGVSPGTPVHLDLSAMSGSASSDLPVSDVPPEETRPRLEIRANTVSGDIRVHRGTGRSSAA